MNAMERRIIKRIISKALAQGARISVYDGEAYAIKWSQSQAAIVAALGATDEDHLVLYDAAGKHLGTIVLIYGNDPDEVVANYTDNAYTRALVGDEEAGRDYLERN